MRFFLTALFALAGGFVDGAPVAIDARETALAATLDLEFQDAMPGGANGAVILEQDGRIALRASYGWADANHKVAFTTKTMVPASTAGIAPDTGITGISADGLYDTYRKAPAVPQNGVGGWTIRKATDGHTLQVSHAGSDKTHFVYFFHRPDDGTLLVLVSEGGDKVAEALRDRMLVSLRDYGEMPVTNMR